MKKLYILLAALFMAPTLALANIPSVTELAQTISDDELTDHIHYLASDTLEGRRTGTKGEIKASQYLAQQFKYYGLLPGGQKRSYFQKFPVVVGRKLGPQNRLSLSLSNPKGEMNLKLGRDYDVYAYSDSDLFAGKLIFAGYGIKNKRYNNYRDIDANGKVIVVLDGISPAFAKKIPRRYHRYFQSLRYKASVAREMGAKAIVVLTKVGDKNKKFVSVPGRKDLGIPALYLDQKIGEKIFSANGKKLSKTIKDFKNSLKPASFAFSIGEIEGVTQVRPIRKSGRNVIAYIPGSHPRLSKEVVVIGAHYDHLGHGGRGSLARGKKAIHNGADDNASGTAAILEVAEALSILQGYLKRTYVFIGFGGEEMGLLGSAYYVKHPSFSLKNTVAMFNLDMVGRLRKKKLYIMGSGTAKEWEGMIQRVNGYASLNLNLSSKGGFGPSDHTSFYKHKIPVLHFFTGLHKDYHKPSDDTDKVNYAGVREISRFLFRLALQLEDYPGLTYQKVKSRRRARRPHGKNRPYLGIIPEYGGSGKGLGISGVSPGSPAQKGGLQKGDVIIRFGKKKIENIYDLTRALYDHEPGDKVKVVVRRKKKKVELQVKLSHR